MSKYPAGGGGASVGEAGRVHAAEEVLPSAHLAFRQCGGREHLEHLYLETGAGQGRRHPSDCWEGRGSSMPVETPQILPRADGGRRWAISRPKKTFDIKPQMACSLGKC